MRRWIALVFLWAHAGAAEALHGPVPVDSKPPYRAMDGIRGAVAAGPNDAVLSYDSGPVYFFPDATVVGSLWGVRFTPAQSCSLMAVSVYAFQGPGTVAFRFFRDNGGQPGSEFSTPQVRTLKGDLTLETVALIPVDVGAGDFYLMMEIRSGPPPYPVTDADGGTGRSWFRYPGQAWEHVIDFDINIRAGVRYYGADLAGPEVVHIPVDLAFSEALSTEIRCGLNDPSGISRAWVHYRVTGSPPFDSTALVYQFDNEWSAELPPYPAGTRVEYYIRAADSSATRNVTTFPSGAPGTLLTYRVHPGREIAYDDGYPDIFFYLDTVWTGNAFAVRMTPPVHPTRVNLLRVFVSDTARFDLEVRVPVGDSVGGLLAGPFTTRAARPFSWVNFEIPDSQQPTIAAGDFVMVLRWKPATPRNPAVGADSVALSARRSYSFDGVYGWFKYSMFNWLMRAAVLTPTGVTEIGGQRPVHFSLGQNYPNPFNPATRIEFAIARPGHVRLSVFNLLGRQVAVLTDEWLPAGRYQVDFEARDGWGRILPSGLYFYRLQTDRHIETRRMVLLR